MPKTSSYQRKGKTPHKYSPAYQRWKNAAMRNDEAEMDEAREAMDRQHPLPGHDREE